MSQKPRKKLKIDRKQKEMIAESLADFFFNYFQSKLERQNMKKSKQGDARIPHKG